MGEIKLINKNTCTTMSIYHSIMKDIFRYQWYYLFQSAWKCLICDHKWGKMVNRCLNYESYWEWPYDLKKKMMIYSVERV